MLAVSKGSSRADVAAILAPHAKQKRPESGTAALHAGHFANALFPSANYVRHDAVQRRAIHPRGKYNATGSWSDAPIEHWVVHRLKSVIAPFILIVP
jgi:hypothetical protein